jgi:hypothetical protein
MSNTGLLDDYLDLDPFAKEVDRHARTVRRWMDQPNGLPFTRIGNRVLIHVPTAREWMFARMRNRNPHAPVRAARRKRTRAADYVGGIIVSQRLPTR